MNCQELRASLHDHFEKRLSAEHAAAFAAHLAACEECAQLVSDASKLTCKELAAFLMDYLDGELPEDQRAVFQRHLELCPPCIDYMKAYERTVELAKDACTSDERPPMPEALVRAILAARGRANDDRA